MKTRNHFLLSALLIAALSIGLAGCSDDDDPVNPMAGPTALRIVHASPDAPNVDVYAVTPDKAQILLFEDIGYGDATIYKNVEPGTYTVELRGAGADPMDPAAFSIELDIAGDMRVTALAAGLLNSDEDDDKFRVIPLIEAFEDPGSGNAAVRIIHASADAPTVAVDVGSDADPEITDFERFEDTGGAGVPLPSGQALNIAIWAGSPLARVAVFTTPALPEGGELFVIATGLVGSESSANDAFTLLAVGPTGAIGALPQDAPAVVYALHGSPNAPAVDIAADGIGVVTDLGFGELSDELMVLPGIYRLSFSATGSDEEAAAASTPYLSPDQKYLAIASGFLNGTPTFQLIALADVFPAADGDAYVQVVHASPDAPPVDVGTAAGGTVTALPGWTNIPFTGTTADGGTMVPVADLSIGVAATGTTEALFTFPVTTVSGLRAYAVAAGSADGSGGEDFRLLLVRTEQQPWDVIPVAPDGGSLF